MSQSCWGIDVGVKRIAFATDRGHSWCLHIGSEPGARRLMVTHNAVRDFARNLAKEHEPLCVWVERPVGRWANPALTDVVGVVQAGLYAALHELYRHAVSVWTISPPEWKAKSVGSGNASKGEVMDWCREHGWSVKLQDEADAIGIAYAGAVLTATAEIA